MSKYALVLVVDAEDDIDAWEDIADRLSRTDVVDFIGDPWPVEDRSYYSTGDLLTQRMLYFKRPAG